MFLGRIVLATGYNEASIVRPKWLTKIFLGGDILCFLVQALGAGSMAKTDASKETKERGKFIILGGLILQLFVFGFFLVVAAIFHARARKAKEISGFQWRKYMFMLYVASGLITIRNIFRVVEYVQGRKYKHHCRRRRSLM